MNFGGLSEEYTRYESADIVILPIPYDETSTWVKGADKGPEAILEASANMELYDIETDSEVFLNGIFTDEPVDEKTSPNSMVESVYQRVGRHIDKGKFIVSLGGEHSVTIGAVKAFKDKVPGICVLQIDAHTDLRPEYEGSRFNHACVMARVREWCPFVQVGIRSMDSIEKPYIFSDRIFYAKDIAGADPAWMDDVLAKLEENVYLTIDLDGLDPSIMPSTGTPEPGGLGYYEVLNLVRKVIMNKNLVGMDIVELCPTDYNKAPDFLASKLIYQILSLKYSKK